MNYTREIDSLVVEKVQKDIDRYYRDYKKIKERQKDSDAYYHGEPVPFLYNARYYTQEELEDFRDIVKEATELFNRARDIFERDEKLRKLWRFSDLEEELCLIKSRVEPFFPISRMDVFYRGKDDYTFCEINTDGSSAMLEDRALFELYRDSELFNELNEKFIQKPFELFDSWVSNFLEHSPCGIDNPVVGIVDIEVDKREFIRFKEAFEKRGIRTFLIKVEDLKCRDDGYLYYNNQRVDMIYRRLVTSDLLRNLDKCQEFIKGIREQKTVFVGEIKSQIIHNKSFFAVLHNKEFQKKLNKSQIEFINRHIPYTKFLDEVDIDKINKDEYLLKPTDSYASNGVYALRDLTQKEFGDLLSKIDTENYLIQKYADLPIIEMIDFESDKVVEDYFQITGLFCYNAKLQGLYSRAGQRSLISGIHGGRTLASVKIGNRDE